MAIVAEIGSEYPETCTECPCFISHFAQSAYCCLGCEYTEEEIKAEENGNLDMYYNGCLAVRPKNCILREES